MRPMMHSMTDESGKDSRKKGFMNVFFAGALIMVLLCTLTLTREAGLMRIRRKELEMMLSFDYRMEAYYLLLSSGAMILNEDEVYGSFEAYEFTDQWQEDRFIRIQRSNEGIIIRGRLFGEERGYYEIRE